MSDRPRYVPRADDEPLDSVQLALVDVLIDILADDIAAQLRDEQQQHEQLHEHEKGAGETRAADQSGQLIDGDDGGWNGDRDYTPNHRAASRAPNR